jgi:hypothetical protein
MHPTESARRGKEAERVVRLRFRVAHAVRAGALCVGVRRGDGGGGEEAARGLVRAEQGLDPRPEGRVAAASLMEVGRPCNGVGQIDRCQEDVLLGHCVGLGCRTAV